MHGYGSEAATGETVIVRTFSGRLFAAAALGLCLAAAGPPALAQAAKPKLVVVIAVDQFSASLFDEWRGRFTGGLRRLADGIAYPSGYQSHAATETCPGHSTILTGKHPSKTGIVANSMRDPATGRAVYCLFDKDVVLAHDPQATPVGPGLLMASTLGEWLKAASPRSRVVAVSGKDRGAITLAGHDPDAVFWLPEGGAGFTTYMRPGEDAAGRLAPMAAVNARILKMMTTQPRWRYAHADCRALAATWTLGGRTWRSGLPPEGWETAADQAETRRRVRASSTYDDATLEGARSLIRSYGLGKGPATDLLAVSFSATDFVGHRYGTRGPEMCEQLHHLDGLVGRLLADLDGLKVPYLVALTADHGGSDLVERLSAQGYDAGRVDGAALLARVNRRLMDELALASPPLAGPPEEPVVARTVPAERRAEVVAAGLRAFLAQPEVAAAFSQAELLAAPAPVGKPVDELTLRERFSESVYPGRSGDILVALQPYRTTYLGKPGEYLAGHGSPWNYDRRVPILFWWRGAPRETRFLPVETVDIAPTLANVLGLAPPADVDGRCLPLTTACPAPR
jgi:predicted AlkP superfamily pyrophosphatase or phosphodiesterase